ANLVMPISSPYLFIDIYLPLKSKIFDRLLLYIRSRTGTVLLPVHNVRKLMTHYHSQQYLLSLVADQNPGNPSKALWLHFFGKPTPFMPGPENIARRNNTPVVFCHFTKIRRGYYQGHPVLVCEEPASLPPGELTTMYVRHLENVIRDNPEMWLWSHRRWKHEWKEEYGKVM
ncbi:MAG: lysophospholipid acyltransferase family protein, partial [Chitinophagaceae bacterium]